MYLMDFNVLVYAYRQDVAHHQICYQWLDSVINGPGYSVIPNW